MSPAAPRYRIRRTEPRDFPAIEALSALLYPYDFPWTPAYLASHREVFPEGQLVAVDAETDEVAGMAASLIIAWDDYDHFDDYDDFTDGGWFTNHDPNGHTLYGAEVMVSPERQGEGIGSMIYAARRSLVEELGLHRIRAGARLPGYHRHADEMTAREYVDRVVSGELSDPTLSFQLKHGFRVLALIPDYLRPDRKSHGFAALIEWLNPAFFPEATRS